MANEQGRRQQSSETQPNADTPSTEMARSGREGTPSTRQYQDPFSVFDSLFERMQRDFFGTSLLNALVPSRGGEGTGSGPSVRMPRVQMRDTGQVLEVTAEMPGIDGANVSATIEDDVLTISGEERTEDQGEGTRTERYSSFYRQIPLPDGVDTEQPQASYRNGVLTVRFAKAQARGSARQIPVSSEQSGQSGQQQSPSDKQGQTRAA